MNSPRDSWQSQLAAQPLPEVVRTKHGVEFDPHSDWWRYKTGNDSVSCNFSLLPPVTPAFLHGFKQALIAEAEKKSASRTKACFDGTLAVLRFTFSHRDAPIDGLTFEELAQFASASKSQYHRLFDIRPALQQWAKTGWHGIEPGLATRCPPCEDRPKGVAVATQDPHKGPLDDQEFNALLEALNRALEQGSIDLDRALVLRLTALLGVRPAQLAKAKVCDVGKDEYGRVVIDMPMAKGLDKATRAESRRFVLEPTTGEVLWDYREELRSAFANRLPDLGNAPLFPRFEQQEKSADESGMEYHLSADAMATRIQENLKLVLANTQSVRLGGEVLRVAARRLRYSFCQRGADEGIDRYTLAHLMCHRSAESVKVYFEVTDRMRARFSRKIAEQMAPIAKVFADQLRILRDPGEATRPIPAARIPDLRVDQFGNLRWLGSGADCSCCQKKRPIGCVTGCPSFEPFLDADFEGLLDRLLTDRAAHEEIDETIAAIRDTAILGCAQIMLRQRELLAQKA